MSYNDEKNKCLQRLLFFTERGLRSGNMIDIEEVREIKRRLTKHKPITNIHLKYNRGGHNQYALTEKQFDNFINYFIGVKDFSFEEDLIRTNKIWCFIKCPLEDVRLLTVALKKSDVSGHNFISNIPRDIKYPDMWAKTVTKLLGYSIPQQTLFKLLQVSNYKRILEAPNKQAVLDELAYIETCKTLYVNEEVTAEPHMLLKDLPYSDFMEFSKNRSDITSIGNKTFCCFKKGGAAESLMTIALRSPIAAIIQGQGLNGGTWFSYIWEMLEFNKETKQFDISLVLDNIESSSHLGYKDYDKIVKTIKEYNQYKAVYLGYCRNDISIPDDVTNTRRPKPHQIPFYGKEVARYSVYDDSRFIYTVLKRDDEDEYKRYSIDVGELHRLWYIASYYRPKLVTNGDIRDVTPVTTVKSLEEAKDEVMPGSTFRISNSTYLYLQTNDDSVKLDMTIEDASKELSKFGRDTRTGVEDLEMNPLNKALYVKYNKKFALPKVIDLEKSYVIRNSRSIKEFELYSADGQLIMRYKSEK